MARSGADSVVLRFPLPYVPWKEGPSWVLWPAYAWRVIAPRPRARTLNVIQRAVLGLCLADVTHVEAIGDRLMIHPALVTLILGELDGSGWIDIWHRPTPEGRRVLEEDTSEPVEDMTVGWVFTDPFTGQIWPRFHAGELPYASVVRHDEGRPTLLSGTIGDPREDRAFEVRLRPWDVVLAARPSADDVLRAVSAHRRQHDWEDEPFAVDPPAVQRVSFVIEEPTDCRLATRVWLPRTGEWQVDDPFGLGQSPRLRRWIEARMESDQGLSDRLEPLVRPASGDHDLVRLNRDAQWRVEERLTAEIRARPQLHERLVAMQRALLETQIPGCPDDKWDDVALKAQRAAERTFLEIREAYPPQAPLSIDEQLNEELINELARSAGFEVPLPPSLARVRRGKVMHAAETGSGSLRALVLLALLGTIGVPDHPLVRAARSDARLLFRLDELATARDRAAHEGPDAGTQWKRRRERIREGIETVFSTVKLLFSK